MLALFVAACKLSMIVALRFCLGRREAKQSVCVLLFNFYTVFRCLFSVSFHAFFF